MKQKLLINLFLGLLLFPLSDSVNATPVQWTIESGGNGHWYDYVQFQDTGWQSAKIAAESSIWDGMTGYLTTITGFAENAFVASIYHGNAYLGANNLSNGTWKWVTGEVFSYTNWWTGEPNNASNSATGENFLMMWHSNGVASQFATGTPDTWNDIFNYNINEAIQGNSNGYINGYFVEFSEKNTHSSPVPLPSSIFLLGTGLGLLMMLRKKNIEQSR